MTEKREKEIRAYIGTKKAGGLMTTEQHYLIDLLAEIDRLRANQAVSLSIGNDGENLFVHGDYDSIKVCQNKLFLLESYRAKLGEAAVALDKEQERWK